MLKKIIGLIPPGVRDQGFQVVVRYFPLWVIKKIPCSYSAYLRCYTPVEGDVVVDCGAHVGNNTILFSRLVGKTGRVYALEPFPESYDRLNEVVEKLGLTNVTVFKKGLWDVNCQKKFRVFEDTSLGANVNNEVKKEVEEEHEIECVALDSLIEALGLKKLNLVKMDIEGAEIEALHGAGNVMKKLSPVFAIASYHIRDGKKTYLLVEKIFKDVGYKSKTFFPQHLTTCGYK